MIRGQPKPRGWCCALGSSNIRGYDTSALFREDCLDRIRILQAEIDTSMNEMEQLKKEHAATEERLR